MLRGVLRACLDPLALSFDPSALLFHKQRRLAFRAPPRNRHPDVTVWPNPDDIPPGARVPREINVPHLQASLCPRYTQNVTRAGSILALIGSLTIAAGVSRDAPQRQIYGGGGRRGSTSRFSLSSNFTYDGNFHFCRLVFRNGWDGDGDGWFVDYPRADENLSIRLSELTKAPVAMESDGTPEHYTVRLTDPGLFQCPFLMMSEPGGSYFDEREAASLRTYLEKGGFLWADDFWGEVAWQNWENQIRKALPASEYPITDISLSHPMLHSLFNIDNIPQVPNVGLWLRAGLTSERGQESAQVHARIISDHHGRVMVFMTHNTDFGDSYEQESLSPDYFQRFSVQGYAIGTDVILYDMTH